MTDEVTESAKAVQSVAVATSTAIQATEKLGRFVAKTISEPLDSTMGILVDRLKYIRWQRQVRLVDKAIEIMEQRKVENKTRIVPPKLAFAIIENGSLEEDDYLQDLWANLLVSAIDPKSDLPRTAFVDIIKQLEPIDVKILEFMYKYQMQMKKQYAKRHLQFSKHYREDTTKYPINKKYMVQHFQLEDDTYETSTDNLMRVRLIESYIESESVDTQIDGWDETHDVSIFHGYNTLCFTSLGISFIKSCTTKAQNKLSNSR